MHKLHRTKNIDIIGVQIDFGASQKGVAMGPLAIRYAGVREDLRRMTIVNGLEGALLAPGLCVPQQMADAGRSKYTCSKVLSQLFKTDIYDKKITIHLNDVHQYIDSIRTSF